MELERLLRRTLVVVAVAGLGTGAVAYAAQRPGLADIAWTIGTVPVIAALTISIVRDVLAGRFGVDAIALISMSGALALGQPLAGAVVALMYAGGNVLEDIAVARAERDLRALVDRAPRVAHRKKDETISDLPVGDVSIGDVLLVRAGEVIPVDGCADILNDSGRYDRSQERGEEQPHPQIIGGLTHPAGLR